LELILQGNLFDQFFRSGKRHKFAKIEKLLVQTILFTHLKTCILLDLMYCENFGRFHPRKSRKSQIKPYKQLKNICLGN